MKILINYANEKYAKAQNLNSWTGMHIAKFDKVYSFGPQDIDPEYYEAHKQILSQARGNGLWMWKPYFIDKVLSQCQDGDYVFYVDSGAFFVRNIDEWIKSFDGEIWASDNPTLENCFTKEKCFTALDCDTEEIRYSNQIQGGFVGLICCEKSRQFVKQWLKYCEDPELIWPEHCGDLMQHPEGDRSFVSHREDQSIFSLLCKKNGVKAHRDPSQRGFFPETFYSPYYAYVVPKHDDTYKTLVFLHKSPKASMKHLIKAIVVALVSKLKYWNRGK